jgi:ABC transporter, phosphonate, periplasmic substrate-binding protein
MKHGRSSILLRWLVLLGMLPALAPAQQAPPVSTTVRIGFIYGSLGNSNRNDVVAAMKAWLLTVAKERNLNTTPLPVVLDSVGEMENALRHHQLDVFSASMEEFLLLEKTAPCSGMFAPRVNGKITEQYVLLVRRDAGLSSLRELQGRDLVVMDHVRTSLAPLWLDSELMRDKLPIGARFFRKVTRVAKPNLAILPVFFKQANAAIVTRSSFDTASELNPQLARELQVLMSSQDLIPGVGAYPKGATSAAVELYRREALRLGESPSGRLIINLFQIDGISEIHESDLVQTRSFLAEYARLKAEAGRRKTTP